MDSKRERIVQQIVSRMALIDGTGDYETDIGGRVKDSETNWAQDQDTLPAISVFDGDALANLTSPADAKAVIHQMSILVKGYTRQGTTAAACRKLMKDILTAIRQDDKWHDSGVPLAMQSRPVKEAITRNEESFEIEGCEVEIAIFYKTDKFNGVQ